MLDKGDERDVSEGAKRGLRGSTDLPDGGEDRAAGHVPGVDRE